MARLRLYCKKEDCWIGGYYNKEKRILYLQLVPCVGLRIELGNKDEEKYKNPSWTNKGCCG